MNSKGSGTHRQKRKATAPSSGGSPAAKPPAPLSPSWIEKNAFAVTAGLMLLIAGIVFHDFIFLKKLFLYKDIGSDTLNGFYPFLKHLADYVRTDGIPRWSFNSGMGQNLFPHCLTQGPYSVLLYLAGKNYVAYALGYVELLKVLSGGMLFYLYLRTLSLNAFTCLVGSLIFAFSGFMIVGGQYFIFSYEAVLLALLLFSFEKLFQQNSWGYFPLAVALIGSGLSFDLYVYGVFFLLYASFRILDAPKWNVKTHAWLLSKMLLLGFLGAGISSLFLFSNVLQLLESPRGSGTISYFQTLSGAPVLALGDAPHNLTALLRCFSNDLLGTGSDFSGWNQHYLEAPMFYTGLTSLLLFPSVFQFLDRRRQLLYAIFLGIWILPVIFPYFRYAFWLFTGDYYRMFSFFAVFPVFYYGLMALNQTSESPTFNPLPLGITLVVLQLVLSVDYSSYFTAGTKALKTDLVVLIRVLLLVYAVLIYLLSRRANRSIAQMSLLLVLCLELCGFSYVTVNNRDAVSREEFQSKAGYNDYTVEAVAYLKSQDQSFFRIDKDYNSSPAKDPSLNDGLVQDYFGTSSYNSFNNLNYVKFLQAVGNSEPGVEWQSRWTRGLGGRVLVECIGNVKYFLTKQNYHPFNYDFLAQFGDVRLMRNKFHLPIGFCYDRFLSRSDYDGMSLEQRDYSLMKSFFIDDDQISEYAGFGRLRPAALGTNYTYDMFAADRDALLADRLTVSAFGQNFVHGKINLQNRKLLFFSIPFDRGWTATVDGKVQPLKVVNAGLTGLILEPGSHTVELDYHPRLFNLGLVVSLISSLLYILLIGWKRIRNRTAKPQKQTPVGSLEAP